MKTIQAPDFDSSTNIDKELESWTLSWQPEGRCGTFNRKAILVHAPAASGVYGLFNFNCQIFIGESENIQEVLLRLERESDFQSEQLRPTGFTFESCAPELRKAKAAELIARFRPVLQTEAALAEIRLVNVPMSFEARGAGQESETDADDHEFPLHRERRSRVHRSFKLKRGRVFALATVLLASAAVIFYVVKPADDAQTQVNAAAEKPPARNSITQSTASRKAAFSSKRQTVASNDAVSARAHKNSEQTAEKPQVPVSSANGELRLAATKASAPDEAGVQKLAAPASTIPTSRATASANSGKKWSVQISAAPAKDVADSLAQRLIAKGYNGYVSQAEVKGQTYYRVRVGPFDAREEAESARQSLARQENYRDAYLTGD